ncbi:hypothetical protein MSG28_004241 [Choristoneura fumiferana]|uniref:Uncharacterized protein n=1 Tax=Choristoneura fumiferana TaxID=7141 RepID=A0ACC0KI61_CHOFU|nr:hypothetical protein MSG28_004241 [Choristoneura fumiferana]
MIYEFSYCSCAFACTEPCNSDQKPVCCDAGCIWFCRLIWTIMTIAFCYYFAYSLISDAKLKFGLFVYM